MQNVLGRILVYHLCRLVASVGSYREKGQVTEIGHFGFLCLFCFLLHRLSWNLSSKCYRDWGMLINKNFLDRDIPGDISGPEFPIVSWKIVFCVEMTFWMSGTSNMMCKIIFPGQDQDQDYGLGPVFPRPVPKIPKFLKIIFFVKNRSKIIFSVFIPLILFLKYKSSTSDQYLL